MNMRSILAVVALMLAVASTLLSCRRATETEPVASNPWPAFDKSSAWDDLQNLVEFGSRAHGAPGHRHAMNYILARLRAGGLQPTVVSFTNRNAKGEFIFNNIEVVLPGKSRKMILVSTHYDARQDAPQDFQSANSSASGPAVLLEIARVLAVAHRPDGPEIRMVFFDGMEPMVRHGFAEGVQGSKHLVRRLDNEKRLRDIIAMINLDMVGDRNLGITLPRNVSKPLRKQLLDAAHAEDARGYFRLVPFEIGDDHDPFYERGVPTINLIDFEYGSGPGRNDYWRTAADTIDKLSADSLDITGRVTLRLIRDIVSPDFQD